MKSPSTREQLRATAAAAVFILAAGAASGEAIYVTRTASGQLVYSNSRLGEKTTLVMQLAAPAAPSVWSSVGPAASSSVTTQTLPRLLRPVRRMPDADTLSLIHQAARRHALDVNLLLALMRQESGFNPQATSHAGARGLMQLMPGTARRYGASQLHDPGENIAAGSAYLRDLMDMFGDVELALAAYNAGEGAVLKYGRRIPPYRETQHYVRAVVAEWRRSQTEK